jgi:hypothetical protein
MDSRTYVRVATSCARVPTVGPPVSANEMSQSMPAGRDRRHAPVSSPTDLLLPVGTPRLGDPPADAIGEGDDGQDGVDAAVVDVQRCIDDVQVVMSPDASRIGARPRVGTSYPDRGTTWHRWGRAAAGLHPTNQTCASECTAGRCGDGAAD